MLLDSRWAFVTGAQSRDFVFTAATAQASDYIDLKAAGFFDAGGKGYVHFSRSGAYTKNALTNLRCEVTHCDTSGGTYVMAEAKDIPVADIDASQFLAKLTLNEGLKRYIKINITPTGAPTTITVNARVTTS